jgi:Domain of unknown function (DUF4430)
VDPPAAETVLSLLDREAEVETRYGGGFVQSIDGIAGGSQDGRRADWFFYVNGVESSVGAAEVDVSGGDRIWWDHHDWTDVMRVPAVVGSWPAPFADGDPAEVVCSPGERALCDEVVGAIDAAGGAAEASADRDRGGDLDAPLVHVGEWEELRTSSRAGVLAGSPARSGVFARFEPAGEGWELALFDATLAERERLGAGAGLVAAVEGDAEAPAWVITGTDRAGVASAIELLDREALEDRFAVATPGEGEPISLPVP